MSIAVERCRRGCTVYRELVTCVGNGVVYELMRDADALCEVIRRDLTVNLAGTHGRRYCPSQPQNITAESRTTFSSLGYNSATCYNGQLLTDQLPVDDSLVTVSCQDLTTIYDDGDQVSDVGCSSTAPAAARVVVVRHIIPPDVDDDESLLSSMIASRVKSFNIDYDAHV